MTVSLKMSEKQGGNMAKKQLVLVHGSVPILAEIAGRAKSSTEVDGETRHIVNIDEALARKLIARRPKNQRSVSDSTVRRYRDTMLSGGWRSGISTPILLDREGNLINGQHRIEAVIDANQKGSFVWRDASVNVLHTAENTLQIECDDVRPRTTRDYVRGLGVAIPIGVQAGLVRERTKFNIPTGSRREQAELAARHPALPVLQGIVGIGGMTAGFVAGSARIVNVAANRAEAVEFITNTIANKHEVFGKPSENIRHLATWLISSRKGYSGDSFFRETTWRVLKAWNDHRDGRSPRILPKYVLGNLTHDIEVRS